MAVMPNRGHCQCGSILDAIDRPHKQISLSREGRPMHQRNWKPWVVSGAAIVVIAVVAIVLLSGPESVHGKIMHLAGNTVVVQDQDGVARRVTLDSTEGLTVGMEVEIDHYNADTMTGDKAHVVPQ